LSTMPIATLFGKLKEHEMELQRLAQTEDSSSKRRGLALKASSSKSKHHKISDDEKYSSESDEDDDEINMLARKFGKFLKRGNNYKRFQSKQGSKRASSSEPPSDKIICFECGKPGHFRPECPNLKEKESKSKKVFKKKAYKAWDGSDDSSSDSDSDVHAKLCLTASHHSDDEVKASSSSAHENYNQKMSYDELYDTCLEMYELSQKYVKQLSGEKKVLKLKDEVNNELRNIINSLKIENDVLKKNDSNLRENLRSSKEQLENLKLEHERLKKTFSRFEVGSSSLGYWEAKLLQIAELELVSILKKLVLIPIMLNKSLSREEETKSHKLQILMHANIVK
jgi:hypothetical protein